MKVIVSCLNSKYVHASLSPWCLLSGVREFSKNTYDIFVMESTINGDVKAFADKIISEKPNVVSFSTYIWNVTKTLEVCRIIKENHECTIVLGGPEVAYRQADVLKKYDFIDFVLSRFTNCNINSIEILVKNKPTSLFKHLSLGAKEWSVNTQIGGINLMYNELESKKNYLNTDFNTLLTNKKLLILIPP